MPCACVCVCVRARARTNEVKQLQRRHAPAAQQVHNLVCAPRPQRPLSFHAGLFALQTLQTVQNFFLTAANSSCWTSGTGTMAAPALRRDASVAVSEASALGSYSDYDEMTTPQGYNEMETPTGAMGTFVSVAPLSSPRPCVTSGGRSAVSSCCVLPARCSFLRRPSLFGSPTAVSFSLAVARD